MTSIVRKLSQLFFFFFVCVRVSVCLQVFHRRLSASALNSFVFPNKACSIKSVYASLLC